MALSKDCIAIGLTGSFGSGCSTLAKALQAPELGFQSFSLSDLLKAAWADGNPAGTTVPTRSDLQDLGNQLRSDHGTEYLARKALRVARNAGGDRIVFDSIKNLGEVKTLRENIHRFYLVAVQCSSEERWARVKKRYLDRVLDHEDFKRDDLRDQMESDLPQGQQVQLCVDEADIVITNQSHCYSEPEAVRMVGERATPYVHLITRDDSRYPSVDESMMGMAYVEATRSRCLKRQVGAVIVDADDEVVSMGLNENPPGKASCYSRKNCEKDSRMRGELDSKIGSPCPTCSSPLVLQQPAYVCANCGHSIKEMLFPDRGMRWCTAMHAEDTAIRLAGSRKLGDCTLYSTTFPCLNCAKAVAYSGIRKITYVEPYPDADSAAFLKEVGINVELFEGVKARAFHRLFWPTRAEMEARYNMGV